MNNIKYMKGDATHPVGADTKAIIHICNNIGAWGAGFVLALNKISNLPFLQYNEWSNEGEWNTKYCKQWGIFSLGKIQPVCIRSDLYVINMIAQSGTRSKENRRPISYEALEECLKKVHTWAVIHEASIHMPRIGCGLAGGKWNKVEEIIKKTLIDRIPTLDITVYDF